MGKLKVTLARNTSQLTKLKSTGYSIIFGRNLKTSNEKESNNKGVSKKNEGERWI